MNNEYVIINKTAIEKRIEEWEIELQECFKAPVGKFNSEYVSTLQQAIATARDFLSQSTPLIPVVERAFDKGGKECENSYFNSKGYKIAKEDYISNLKLDI